MNPKTRFLPHLNSYFLQRKAYEQHRKKIDDIRRSISKSRIRIKSQISQIKELLQNSEQSRLNPSYSINTIKEEHRKQIKRKLSPKEKRDQYEIRKENLRLLDRIHKCHPTIKRKEIERHDQRIRQMKQRLCRFVSCPNSNKVLLKCRQSLQILRKRQIQSQQGSIPISRNHSRLKYAKSEASHLETHISENQNESASISKKSSFVRFYLLKNSQKVKQHFDSSDFRQAAYRNFQTLKTNFWKHSKKRIRTQIRSKIFTTEPQL